MPDLGRCGRYRLLERIGAGGMGEIFLAEEDGTGRTVAVKRLLEEGARDPVFIGMFLDEARLVDRMRHPNVCETYEHDHEGQHYFLAMEYIDGVSLHELMASRGGEGLPFPLAARIIAEVASGLDYAHRLPDDEGLPLGIVHRDVSPANIMIARDGRVKLVDFGLAKARTQLVKTQPGLVKGRFGYLAPEQLAGHVDWRTDLFALGLCFYEAVTGKQLFGQSTAAQTVMAIRRFRGPPPIEGAPEGLAELLGSVLQFDPAKRPESAAAFRAAIGRAVVRAGYPAVSADELAALVTDGENAEPSPPKALSSIPPPRGSFPLLLGLLATAAAIVLGLVLWQC